MLTQWLLPNNYRARKDAIGTKLGELMDLIDNIKVGNAESKSQDVLERIYECFLGKFADAEGK
jgi:type I restriction enzyme M protein